MGSTQKVWLQAEIWRGDTRTPVCASIHCPPGGAKSTTEHKGGYQELREAFQTQGPADPCEVLLFLLRVMGLAKMRAAVEMIRANK